MILMNSSKKILLVVTVLVLVGGVTAGILYQKGNKNTKEVVATQTEFNSANFVNPLKKTNEYHPLLPGMQWIRGGTTEVGSRKVPHRIITTMTDVVRIIDGVPAIAMLDQSEDSGEIAQVGFDYLAIDKDGNVWILGGYTAEYESGEFTNVEGAYLGESAGGQVGILHPAVVTMDTPRWIIGTPGPDEAASVGEPVAINQDVTVLFGEFHNVRVIREGAYNAPDNEFKYYAPGVGVVWNVPQDKSLHQDYFELINFTQLSPEGLAEASQVVIDLEEQARVEIPGVYANASRAQRILADGTIVKGPEPTMVTPKKSQSSEETIKSDGAVVPAVSTGVAQSAGTPGSKQEADLSVNPVPSTAPKISEGEAKVIALQAVPGKVMAIESDVRSGVDVYIVEVDAESGVETDVIINTQTGKIISTET